MVKNIDNINLGHRGYQILSTIKRPRTCNRKPATEGVPLRYFSL